MNKTEFIEYLRSTLIPDLLASGMFSTACDFEAACRFMEGARTVAAVFDDAENFCNEWRSKELCSQCGGPKPIGQSCLCFDNNCE